MFSIGEFSTISCISVRTLRFYHEQGLLIPAAVDRETGYRSYDERNLEAANVIVALRGLEFSLGHIRVILEGASNDADMLVHLQRQREAIAGRLQSLRGVAKKLDNMIQQHLDARDMQKMTASSFEIEERDLAPCLIAGTRMTGRYSEIGSGLGTLCKRLGRHITGNPLCLYYDGEYREEDANFEPCVPIRTNVNVEGISVRELPAERCVTLIHQGPYEEMRHSYARILKYAKQHGYEIDLPMREVYLKGPGMIFRGNPKKYLTEIQIPVRKHANEQAPKEKEIVAGKTGR